MRSEKEEEAIVGLPKDNMTPQEEWLATMERAKDIIAHQEEQEVKVVVPKDSTP